MTTLRCGRLDDHEPHTWSSPAWGERRHYECTGHVITECEWREYAKQADADEARAEVAASEAPLFDATVAEHPQVALWMLARELDDDEAVAAWIGDAS